MDLSFIDWLIILIVSVTIFMLLTCGNRTNCHSQSQIETIDNVAPDPVLNPSAPLSNEALQTIASVYNGGNLTANLMTASDTLTANNLKATKGTVGDLTSSFMSATDTLTANNLKATKGTINDLSAPKFSGTDLTASGILTATNLKATKGTIDDLSAPKFSVADLTASGTLTANNLKATKGTIDDLSAPKFSVTDLTTTNATATNLTATNATATNFTGAGIKLSKGWSGYPDDKTDGAEISNDTGNYKTLMIVGNKSGGGARRVGLWDEVTVNGALNVTGITKFRNYTNKYCAGTTNIFDTSTGMTDINACVKYCSDNNTLCAQYLPGSNSNGRCVCKNIHGLEAGSPTGWISTFII